MKNRIWILFGMLLAGLLWLLALRPEAPAVKVVEGRTPPVRKEAPPPEPQAPPARKLVAQIPPPEEGPAGIPGEVWTPEGLLRANGILLVSRKVLPETGKGLAAPFEITVKKGLFLLTGDLEALSPEEVLDPRAFLYEEQGGGDCRAEELRWGEAGETPLLQVVLGRRHHLECFVRNLKGDPIPGARVKVGVPLPIMGSRGFATTDEDGLASFGFFTNARKAVIRAFAEGFEMKASMVALDEEPARAEVKLGRILASGFVRDLRFPTRNTRFMEGGPAIVFGPRLADWKTYLKRIEDRLELEESQRVTWNVLAEGNEWYPLDKVDVLGEDSDGKPFHLFAPLLKVTDPQLKPILLPRGNDQVRFPVRIRLLPRSAFLAPPPEWLRIGLVSEEGVGFRPSSSGEITARKFNASGSLWRDTTYLFFLPLGNYTVTMARTKMDPGLERLPRFIPSGPLVVEASQENPLFDLYLEPDERFIRCQAVDAQGFPVDLKGFLAIQKPVDWRGFIAESGGWPGKRFIRPGTFAILAHDEPSFVTVPILENLIWPAPVTKDGVWRIPIPDLSEPASAERFH